MSLKFAASAICLIYSFCFLIPSAAATQSQQESDTITLEQARGIEFAAGDGAPDIKEHHAEVRSSARPKDEDMDRPAARIESGDRNEGVPFLSRIPLVGRLFRSKAEEDRKAETVVLVEPRIVSPDEE